MIEAKEWGKMAAIHGLETVAVPLELAVGSLKTLDMRIHEDSKHFFGANKLHCPA
jgi:hypothetical protein